jgi:hypothetical protein
VVTEANRVPEFGQLGFNFVIDGAWGRVAKAEFTPFGFSN